MTSAKAKGDQAEREVLAIFESRGYRAIKSPRTMKRVFLPGGKQIFVSQSNDFFNLFDICAKKGQDTIWIQVKGDASDVYKAKTAITDFKRDYCSEHESCQIWLRVPRKGYIIYHIAVAEYLEKQKDYVDLKGIPSEPFLIS